MGLAVGESHQADKAPCEDRGVSGDVLTDYTEIGVVKMDRIKYPRTPHLPWSEGVGRDDLRLLNVDNFKGKHVTVTVKYDGENTTMSRDYIHARSTSSGYHESRTWVARLWANTCYMIESGFRICGENVYAAHSIFYDDLPSYFLGFSLWQDLWCHPWATTELYIKEIGLYTVPVIYSGIFDEKVIKSLWTPALAEKHEGYVVRSTDAFALDAFGDSVAKYVRPEHVNTNAHWMYQTVRRNLLIPEAMGLELQRLGYEDAALHRQLEPI